MTPPLRIASVVGARPQFIKAAPVSVALRKAGVDEVLIHTGQHHDRELSDVFFAELGIPAPSVNLGIHGGTSAEMIGRMLPALAAELQRSRVAGVLVFGDTNSTLAAALASAQLSIPLAHVEAGLRSFNRQMPEEINRVLTDHLSDLLFCPTRTAVKNLAEEGRGGHALHVGDVMYDVALSARDRARRTTTLEDLGSRPTDYVVATVHRAENTADATRLQAVLDYIRVAADGRKVVLPLHPRTAAASAQFGLDLGDFITVPPVGFLEMTRLIMDASAVLTDSGGLQKEAYFHRVPCVVLREETEWVETVDAGWNRLWTVERYIEPRQAIDEYGDGHAAERIVEVIVDSWTASSSA